MENIDRSREKKTQMKERSASGSVLYQGIDSAIVSSVTFSHIKGSDSLSDTPEE